MYKTLVAIIIAFLSTIAPAAMISVDQLNDSLDNYITNTIIFETENDWLSSQLIVTLYTGTIYQDSIGGIASPNPLLINSFPSLEFDTYVSNGILGDAVSAQGGAINLGGEIDMQFDELQLNVNWFSIDTTDVGILELARITLSEDAIGIYKLWTTAVKDSIYEPPDVFIVENIISNGIMIPEPSVIVLLCVDGLCILSKRQYYEK